MKRIRLIASRDFYSIMCSSTGLIILAVYLLLAGYLFYINVVTTLEATLRYVFGGLGMVTVFVVPIITMRSLSEELRSGTFETLTTHPVTDREIVLGKFMAGCAVFAMLSLPTLAYLFILQAIGTPDWKPALAGYAGQQLMAAMLVALGVLISSLTSSQVLSALGALVGGTMLILAGTASESIQGKLGAALSYLAIMQHFSLFRRGVIDSRAVVFFVGTTVMFLYLAVRAVESRRWKFGVIPVTVPRKWFRPVLSLALLVLALLLVLAAFVTQITGGLWSTLDTLLLVAAVILVLVPAMINRGPIRYHLAHRHLGIVLTVMANSLMVIIIWALMTFFTSRHYVRFDVSSSQHYSLSPQTHQILKDLNAPVEIIATVHQATDLQQEVDDLLSEYKACSSQLSSRKLDPVRSPSDAEVLRERFKLTSPLSEELMVIAGDKYRRVPLKSLVQQKMSTVNGQIVGGMPQFVGEAELTSAIIQLTRTTPGTVVFLSGHGERNPDDASDRGASTVTKELIRNGWTVRQHVVTPGSGAMLSSNAMIVVVAGPQAPLSDEDTRALATVVDHGGGILFLLDPGVKTGLDSFLFPWDVRLGDDLVVDLQNHLGSADPSSLYVKNFNQDHPIGKGMGTLAAVLPTARRIAVNTVQPNPSVFTHNFMHTSGNGWAVTPKPGEKTLTIDRKKDHRGPISLGVACERSEASGGPGRPARQGRIILIGDSDFISNQYVDMAGNMNLFLNCVDWMANRQDLISVRPKVVDARLLELTLRQTQTVFWVSLVLVPLGSVLVGLAMVRKRRQRS